MPPSADRFRLPNCSRGAADWQAERQRKSCAPSLEATADVLVKCALRTAPRRRSGNFRIAKPTASLAGLPVHHPTADLRADIASRVLAGPSLCPHQGVKLPLLATTRYGALCFFNELSIRHSEDAL